MGAAPPDPAEGFVLIGFNHRSAGLELRECLQPDRLDPARLEADVRAAGFGSAIVVATCDRLEAVVHCEAPERSLATLAGVMASWTGSRPEALAAQSYRHRGRDALRHLFAVAASLDSQVIGEPQILGQVKESHRRAAAAGLVDAALDAAMNACYATAKRIRRETPLAEEPVTLAASAVRLARDLHGDLEGAVGLLVGLGEIGELLALQFQDAGLGRLLLSHPSAARAEAAARRLTCNVTAWEALDDALAGADVVISAVGTGRYSFTARQLRAALKRRRQKPIFLIDCAVPPDLDPAIDRLDGAFVYGIADLESFARRGQAARQTTAAAAWRILEEELDGFLARRAERAGAPAVSLLRRHFEQVRREVLANDAGDAEAATRALVNRLLHDPSEVLRQTAAREGARVGELEGLLRRLFRLGDERTRK